MNKKSQLQQIELHSELNKINEDEIISRKVANNGGISPNVDFIQEIKDELVHLSCICFDLRRKDDFDADHSVKNVLNKIYKCVILIMIALKLR